tara:strand:- start:57 stop:455 length:399 start_codon:yes stop_codon:yes gene_type:complete
MKKLTSVILILLISLSACKTTESYSIGNSNSGELKRNQHRGIVIEKSRRISRSSDEKISEYFLRTNSKDYYVKYDEGYISYEKLKAYLNKEIIFKGDFKKGPLEKEIPASISNPIPPKVRIGDYVAIYKIYK